MSSDGCRVLTVDCLVSVVVVHYWLSSGSCRVLLVDCLVSVVEVVGFDRQCRLSLIFRRLT
jgi:hypothetical protein